ncbi:DUF72 domain-containing protein [Companilactobacillus sp. DQM5]|uniref:DUF72 domain-containing protein n=1 Tax=Companilactobacillus sp. DQM5 TaxID=3463359 RepID=UPI004057E1E0
MIKIGLTNWAKHPDLIDKKTISLKDYASFYSCVEVDSFFYGIKNAQVVKKWSETVDENFDFIVKASKEITKQADASEIEIQEQCNKLVESLVPLKNKLAGVLLQFPPFFDVKKENIEYLSTIFNLLHKLPLIVEFRHKSWYSKDYYLRTINFIKKNKVTLAMVDEPQITDGCIPFDITVTNNDLGFFRFHGRNTNGWFAPLGFETGSRTNYDYSDEELEQLAKKVKSVSKNVKKVVVIFNNNGGLHANKNAIKFQKILNLKPKNMQVEQIELL